MIDIKNWATGEIILSAPTLVGIELHGADLAEADFTGEYLRGANFCDAILLRAKFSRACLVRARFRGAHLGAANFSLADLRSANFECADITDAVFDHANLEGVCFHGATLGKRKVFSLLARATRSDGHEFFAFITEKGLVIRAGWQTLTPKQFRRHVESHYPGTSKASETLAIIDYFEARHIDLHGFHGGRHA
jgi:hypothetical protein